VVRSVERHCILNYEFQVIGKVLDRHVHALPELSPIVLRSIGFLIMSGYGGILIATESIGEPKNSVPFAFIKEDMTFFMYASWAGVMSLLRLTEAFKGLGGATAFTLVAMSAMATFVEYS
jgi:hypothetical protein